MKQQLTRSAADKMIAGVCGGVARSFGIDLTLVRVVWALASVFTGIPIAIYLVLWLVLPIDGGSTGLDEVKRAFSSNGSNQPPSDLR